MYLNKSDIEYLKGIEYINGYKFKPLIQRQDYKYISKINFLKELALKKSIIHVGCVDHNIETIEKKILKNKWLHKHLNDVALECIGIDIKEKEILYLKNKYNYNVIATDISKDKKMINKKFDYMFIPDVLEHIGNPVHFLSHIHDIYKKNIQQIVITVPNAFSRQNFKNAKKNIELINSDHKFWFTPYTISKVLIQSGFNIKQILLYNKASLIKKYSAKHMLYNIYIIRKYIFMDSIFLRPGIIIIADF